ncbi:tetratricopeptide repeat protein [Melioribacter sp. OK-6-Me]|uniref:tetratricopeptide repeat protein n=1 Tax=unclassified Melioribacter TaxID=2627329 RepID=UPI003ED92D45
MNDDLKCISCGKKLEKDFVYCPYCGTKTGKSKNVISNDINSSNEKVLSFKKIIYLVLLLIVVGGVILYSSGVFDEPEIKESASQDFEDVHNGVDLSNLQQINALENELKANPGDKEKILTLAHMLNDSGFKQKAIDWYQEYLKYDSSDADVLVDMGVCYYEMQNYTEAEKWMKEALKYQPDHQIAHLNLGIVSLSTGKHDEAIEWWKKAVEIDPNNNIGKRAQELINSH